MVADLSAGGCGAQAHALEALFCFLRVFCEKMDTPRTRPPPRTPVQGAGACTRRAWRVGVQVVCVRPLVRSTSACACVQTGRGGGEWRVPAYQRRYTTVARGWRGWCPLPSYRLRRCAVLYGIQYVYTINRLLRVQIVLCSYGIVLCVLVLGTPTRGYAAH